MTCITVTHKHQWFVIRRMLAKDIEHIGYFLVFLEFLIFIFDKLILNNFLLGFSVNSAFVSLRQLIPTEPKTRKLSKIETLRLAHSYIEHLVAMLITGMFLFFHLVRKSE